MAHWLCMYRDRAGAHARAKFVTRDRAIQFAERHASVVAPSGMLITWEDAGEVTVLTTPRGDYVVAPVDDGGGIGDGAATPAPTTVRLANI